MLIFSFFDEAVGFVAEHKWALTAFVARLTGTWVMQKKKKKKQSNTFLWSETIHRSLYFHDPQGFMKKTCFTHHSGQTNASYLSHLT